MKENTNEKGFQLYSLLSETNERYVAEALDDGLAAEIKAKNRRKRIQMRSAFAACAAVLVLVIGISALPDGRLERSAEKNDTAQITADEAPEQVGAADDAAPADRDDAGVSFGETDGMTADAAEEQTPESDGAVVTNGTDDKRNETDEPEVKTADENAETETDMKVKPLITAENGMVYTIANKSSEAHKGKYTCAASEGTLYEFDNFPTRAIALVQIGDSYEVAVNDSYTCDTFDEMFRDFAFRHYLHCDSIGAAGKAIEPYGDAEFQDEVWGLLFEDPAACKAVDDSQIGWDAKYNDLCFTLHLGTQDETFCSMQIFLNKQGYMYVWVEDGLKLCFENKNSAEIIELFS